MTSILPVSGKSSKVQSCLDCINFVSKQETATILGKSINTPVCSKFGRILSSPHRGPEHLDKLCKFIGSKCQGYTEFIAKEGSIRSDFSDKSGLTTSTVFTVAIPKLVVADSTIEEKKQVKACTGCRYFIQDYTVLNEWGWSAGACEVKGKLILQTRAVQEAKNCNTRRWGNSVYSTENLQLLPEYEPEFWKAAALKEWLDSLSYIPDPQEYISDKSISKDDEASGIRAWRKIIDPEGFGEEVFLPIYDVKFFCDTEAEKIPKSKDEEHPEMYIDHNGAVYKLAVSWSQLDETPMLWGISGSGKTELFRHAAWLMGLPFERISVTASTELDDLSGKFLFIDNETVFKYGRIPIAWSKPCVILLDEPNTGPPEVWQFLRPLTDNSKQLVLDQNKGERVLRHESCFLGMACNPAWDPRNVGANSISDADGNRLLHIFMDLPPEDIEKEIIRKRTDLDGWTISEEKLSMVMRIAHDIRDMSADGTLSLTWGIRPQIKVARALRWFPILTAYRVAVADFLEPEAATVILDIVRSHSG